jgi:hypothetical protein
MGVACNVVPTTVGKGYDMFGSDGTINGLDNDSYRNYPGLAG